MHCFFDNLIRALSECDESSGTATEALVSWAEENGGINSDVIVPENDNRGSPLLIACELDLPYACRALIALGADVNYRHPSAHGNAPLLRCAEMGYDDCLKELLAAAEIDVVNCETREYKLVLGQNIPQYEAGGRSALMLAVESGRVKSVEILLQHEQGRQLLERTDSFGRTPIETAFEKLALQGEKDAVDQEAICRKFCAATRLDYDKIKVEMQPTEQEAKTRERVRNISLRARYLKNANSKKEADVARGLQAVESGYNQLRAHPQVYERKFPSDALLLDVATVSGVSDNSSITEPLPGAFTFPLLSQSYCRAIYQELLHYEKTALERPELGLPLHVRHDGNFGSLQDCGFRPLLQAVEAVFQPLVRSLMPNKGHCEVYHAFLTRNYVSRDENTKFKVHCDKSDLTFNICLQASDEMEGSTVGFYSDPSGVPGGTVPTNADRVYTYRHQVGHAVMHDGRQWHKTDPITCGTRSSLIVWARLSGSACSECGAATGATWLFCKQCGKEIPKATK